MAAYVSNIVIDVGTDFTQTFYLETIANTPVNLTGNTATSKMKKNYSSMTTAASFSVSFPNPTNGTLSISLGSSITSGLKPGRYCYDVLVNDGTRKTRVVEGSALVTAGITTG